MFARYYELIYFLCMVTWFADSCSSWQRGSNENGNGKHLPKSTSLGEQESRPSSTPLTTRPEGLGMGDTGQAF